MEGWIQNFNRYLKTLISLTSKFEKTTKIFKQFKDIYIFTIPEYTMKIYW